MDDYDRALSAERSSAEALSGVPTPEGVPRVSVTPAPASALRGDEYDQALGRGPVYSVEPPQPWQGVDWGDVGKGAAGGFGRGVTGMLGLGGTVGDLSRAGLTKLGVPENMIDLGSRAVRAVPMIGRSLTGPSTSDIQSTVEKYTGPFYQPKTVPGQYASTIAEFAPAAVVPGGGGVGARVFNTVVPALASESAGQITKGTAAEPWARGIAGLAAGPIAAKLVTPTAPASAMRQAAVDTLEGEGIPLTAGQRTGSKPLQWMEATAADMPFSAGRAARLNAAQNTALDRAVTGHLFDRGQLTAHGVPEGVNLPDPRVVVAGRQSLSDEYARLAQANQLRSDQQLQRELLAAQIQYERNILPSQRTADIGNIRNDITDRLVQGQGFMPGDVYQAVRSRLGTLAKGQTNNPYQAAALRDMRTALDAAMQRGLSPADAAAWTLNNQRWANMRQIDPAVARAGENLSPLALAQTTRTGRAAQHAAQTGDLDPLTKAAALVMKPMPQSGTAPRTGWQQLFNAPALLASGGGAGVGSYFGPMGTVLGIVAPFAASRAVLSRPVQSYLGNRLLPQNTRDIIAQELMQQAISQPGKNQQQEP